jgi:hypothetical protein
MRERQRKKGISVSVILQVVGSEKNTGFEDFWAGPNHFAFT